MKYIKQLTIDIDKKNNEVVQSVQYDSKTRFIHINLVSNAMPFDITGCSVKVSGIKSDNTGIFNNCTVLNAKEGFIEVEVTEQMNAVEGLVKCELKLYDGKGVLTTKQFNINVTESVSNKTIESSNEFGALTEALNKVNNIDNKFNELTTEAVKEATEIEIQKQLSNGSLTYLTIADNSITGNKIKDNEVGISKIRNVTYSLGKNLFDKNTMCVSGKGINSTGVIGTRNWTLVEIPVNPNTTYSFKHLDNVYTAVHRGALGYLSKDKQLISYVDMSTLSSDDTGNGKIFTTPNNCYYIAKNGSMTTTGTEYINNFQLEEGTSITDFEEYSKVLSEIDGAKIGGIDKELATKVQNIENEVEELKNIPPSVSENSINVSMLKDVNVNFIDDEGTNNPSSLNLFNKNTMVVKGCLANNNGSVSNNANASVAVIPVNPQTVYSLYYNDNVYAGAQRGKLQFCSEDYKTVIQKLTNITGPVTTVNFDSVEMSGLDYTDDGRKGKIFTTPSGTKCIVVTVVYNTTNYTDTLIVQKGRNITSDLEPPTKPQVKEFYGFDGYKVVDEDVRNIYDVNKFYGKRWAIFGDSLSQPNTDGLDKYHDRISKKLNMTNISYAVGGSGYMKSPAIYTKISEALPNFDIISIMAGVNEKTSTLGTIDDTGTDTLCGCVKKAISDAQQKYPLATIFVMTSIPGEGGNPLMDKQFNEYCKKIKEICEMYGVPCLDLFHMSGLKPWIPANKEKYYRDYIHLIDEGQEYLSKIVFNFMNTLF